MTSAAAAPGATSSTAVTVMAVAAESTAAGATASTLRRESFTCYHKLSSGVVHACCRMGGVKALCSLGLLRRRRPITWWRGANLFSGGVRHTLRLDSTHGGTAVSCHLRAQPQLSPRPCHAGAGDAQRHVTPHARARTGAIPRSCTGMEAIEAIEDHMLELAGLVSSLHPVAACCRGAVMTTEDTALFAPGRVTVTCRHASPPGGRGGMHCLPLPSYYRWCLAVTTAQSTWLFEVSPAGLLVLLKRLAERRCGTVCWFLHECLHTAQLEGGL
jgi:hypothetical protein